MEVELSLPEPSPIEGNEYDNEDEYKQDLEFGDLLDLSKLEEEEQQVLQRLKEIEESLQTVEIEEIENYKPSLSIETTESPIEMAPEQVNEPKSHEELTLQIQMSQIEKEISFEFKKFKNLEKNLLGKDISDLKSEIQTLVEQKQKKLEQKSALENEIHNLKSNFIFGLQRKLESLTLDIESEKSIQKTLVTRIECISSVYSETIAQITSMRQEISERQLEHQSIEAEHLSVTSTLNSSVLNGSKLLESIKQSIYNESNKKNKLETTLRSLQAATGDLKAEITSLKEQISIKNSEKEATCCLFKRESPHLLKEITLLESEIVSHKETHRLLIAKKENLDMEIETLKLMIKPVREELLSYKKDIKYLLGSMEKTRKSIEDLKTKPPCNPQESLLSFNTQNFIINQEPAQLLIEKQDQREFCTEQKCRENEPVKLPPIETIKPMSVLDSDSQRTKIFKPAVIFVQSNQGSAVTLVEEEQVEREKESKSFLPQIPAKDDGPTVFKWDIQDCKSSQRPSSASSYASSGFSSFMAPENDNWTKIKQKYKFPTIRL